MFFSPYIVARWHPLYVFALYSLFSFPWSRLCLSAVLAGLPPPDRGQTAPRGMVCWTGGRAAEHSPTSPGSRSRALASLFSWEWGGSEPSPRCHVQTWAGKRAPVLSAVAIDPHQSCGNTSEYEFLGAMTLAKSVSVVIGVSFILNRCIVMSKMLPQNFPRIWALHRAFRLSLLKSMPGACLPVLSWQVSSVCRLARWAPTFPGQVFRNWHNTNGSVRPQVSPAAWPTCSPPGKVAWSSLIFSNLGVNWSVLCSFPCTERCCEMM